MAATPQINLEEVFKARDNLSKLKNEKINDFRIKSNFSNFMRLFDTTCYKAQTLINFWSSLESGKDHEIMNRIVVYEGQTYLDKTLDKNSTEYVHTYVSKAHTRSKRNKSRAKPKSLEDWTLGDFGQLILNDKFMRKQTRKKLSIKVEKEDITVSPKDKGDNFEFCFIIAADDTNLKDFINQLRSHVKDESTYTENKKDFFVWHRSFSINPRHKDVSNNFNSIMDDYTNFIQSFDRRWIFLKDFSNPKVLKSSFCWFEISTIEKNDCFMTEFLDVVDQVHDYIHKLCDPYEYFNYNDNINKIYPILTRIEMTDPLALQGSSSNLTTLMQSYISRIGFKSVLDDVKKLFLYLIGVSFVNYYTKDLVGEFNEQNNSDYSNYSYIDKIGLVGVFLRRLDQVESSANLFFSITEEVLEFAYLYTTRMTSQDKDKVNKKYCIFLIRKARTFLLLYRNSNSAHSKTTFLMVIRATVTKIEVLYRRFNSTNKLKLQIRVLLILLQADICYFVDNSPEEIAAATETLEETYKKFKKIQQESYATSQQIINVRSNRAPSILSGGMKLSIETELAKKKNLTSIVRLKAELAMKIATFNLHIGRYVLAKSYAQDAVKELALSGFEFSALHAKAFVIDGDCNQANKDFRFAASSYNSALLIYCKIYGECNILTKELCDKLLECNKDIKVVDDERWKQVVENYRKYFKV